MADRGMSSWEQIKQSAADVERLIGQKQYNLAMVKSRQTLEFMVKSLADPAGVEAEDLSAAIDELYRRQIISKATMEHYHTIRKLGNQAIHEGDSSAGNANTAYHLLSQEMYTFSSAYAARSSARSAAEERRSAPAAAAALPSSRSSAAAGTRTASDRSRTIPNSRTGSTARSASSVRIPNSRTGSVSSRTADRSAASGTRPKRRKRTIAGLDPEMIFRILVPILAVILLIALIRFISGKVKKADPKPAETPVPVETQVVPETVEPTEAFTLPQPAEVTPETTAVVVKYYTTAALRVRTAPGLDAGIVTVLESGTEVDYIEEFDTDWAKIRYEGQEAYVSRQYLRAEQQ